MSVGVFVPSGGTKRSIFHASVLMKLGKKGSFNTHGDDRIELGMVTLNGGRIPEIKPLLINKEIRKGGLNLKQ